MRRISSINLSLCCIAITLRNWQRGTVFEAYAKNELAADKDIQIAVDDSREVRELKQIVNGMREEMREYLANGNGTPRSVIG